MYIHKFLTERFDFQIHLTAANESEINSIQQLCNIDLGNYS